MSHFLIITFCLLFQQPFRCDMEHKFGVSCFNSGSVLCRVILDHGGYVPGETILVSAIIRNRSNVHIKCTKASLREVWRCFKYPKIHREQALGLIDF